MVDPAPGATDPTSEGTASAADDGAMRLYGPLVGAAALVILVDQITKAWAVDLAPCNSLDPRPTFAFCLAHNEGMAFSVGWGKGPIISLVALVIVAVMFASVRKVPMSSRWLMGAVAGGAIGNVIDRAVRAPATGAPGFMRGAVVDFLYSSFWATFNVADAAIVVGGILLSIALWRVPDAPAANSIDDDDDVSGDTPVGDHGPSARAATDSPATETGAGADAFAEANADTDPAPGTGSGSFA